MPNAVEEFLQHSTYEEVDLSYKIANTTIDQVVEAVLNKQDCILYGPPGTSKTYMIDKLSEKLADKLGLFEVIQFHANYSYEEFIEGIVPDVGNGGFKFETGTFYNFCRKALEEQYRDKISVFVIDEINRANVTAVFGEVMNLMEDKGQRKLKTSKQHLDFCIPSNVVIVGTMNTADKTLAKLDFAFRRRFRFLSVYPSSEILHTLISASSFSESLGISIEDYIDCFNILNAKITKHPLLGKDLTLGHVLWMRKDTSENPYTKEDIGKIFRETIFPQIESYCGSNRDILGSLLGPELRDRIIFGYEITDDVVIEFLSGLKNSKVVKS